MKKGVGGSGVQPRFASLFRSRKRRAVQYLTDRGTDDERDSHIGRVTPSAAQERRRGKWF
jgi:hypothetical protein